MKWKVIQHPEVAKWLDELAREDPTTYKHTLIILDLLGERGPGLGRPFADTLRGSKIHNLKELRPAARGQCKVRILFVFDPARQAVLLAAGDKAGEWEKWYRRNIALAEERYFEYLRSCRGERR